MTISKGLFFCSGCDIGNSIDVEQILSSYSTKQDIVVCKSDKQLCSDESIHEIKQNIIDNQLDAVIIAACSKRYQSDRFLFDKLTERVNIRELVCYSHVPNNHDTQILAEDYIKMSLARTDNIKKAQPYFPENFSKVILVVGGGITGISAAINGAKAGYDIILIEKDNELGGKSNIIFKRYPNGIKNFELKDTNITDKINELGKYKKIKVMTGSRIKSVAGQPGDFMVNVEKDNEIINIHVGAIIMATGWELYNPDYLTEFKYGLYPDIVTNYAFEEMVKKGNIVKPSDNTPPQSILFIQCAGSRDNNHLPYCSNYCCPTTLKQSKYVRDFLPQTKVFIVYKDIRTPGHLENFYKSIQNDELLFLTKGKVSNITKNKENLSIEVTDTIFNENIDIQADMIVLAMGMTPNHQSSLNLNYRLGADMPTLKYNFPDSHFICFPYETKRTGIFTAGSVRSPMDITSCKEDAKGAMLKAIQCVELVHRGEALHPRTGDYSFPSINFHRCTDCKRCTEECPFGTYNENEKGTPIVFPTRCRRCGICMGACPERVINFDDFNIQSVSAMIKSVSMPDEFEEKPRILAFVCENDAYPAFDIAAQKRLNYNPFIRIIPVRCLGSVNKIWISDALSKGFDGILLIGCKPGDNYQCHFIHGSELTEKRGENIAEVLQKMMLESERIKTIFLEINEYSKIPQMLDSYLEEINQIGLNPFKEL